MLPTVGYKWNSEHTAVSERTQQQESHWRSWLRGCRLDEASHFGLSLTALRKRKATEAELLGAEIEVSSAPGRGATFRINVPFDGPLATRT